MSDLFVQGLMDHIDDCGQSPIKCMIITYEKSFYVYLSSSLPL